MNLPFFIAKRMALGQQKSFSSLIIKIAIAAIALSLAVMLISTALVMGFKKEISNKVFGFGGHIQITSFDANRSFEDLSPISKNETFYPYLDTLTGIKNVQVYAHKIGVLKNEETIEGIILKGIGSDFDWSYFQTYLKEGTTFEVQDSIKSNAILLSQYTANRLGIGVGEEILSYFVQKRIRYRKFKVVGIFKTGIEEVDERFAIVDIAHIQKLNKWEKDEVGGCSVILDDVANLEPMNEYIHYQVLDPDLKSVTVKQLNPGIFEWLELQNMNEIIILTLMVIVAVINMITALLILILERTNMIGILKALGTTNQSIRWVFLYNAAYIIGIGLLLGNLIGLGICALQHYFEFITLPEESYYLSVAPIDFNWLNILIINIGTFLVALLALIVPSYLVSFIDPIKAIRFE